MSQTEDTAYMEMAYALADRGRGRVSPNPCVGAVIVRNGRILGCGWHEGPGKPHAEIVALESTKSGARDATFYITLEPCTHWGRTPPCVDRLLAAAPARVVISDKDPNPLVDGRGIKKLQAAGVEVAVGPLAWKNRRLNEAYIKYITLRRPFVLLKAALSMDGKLATHTGHSQWISSPETRDYIHLTRGECDALMVGIGTILSDDPRLTVRHPRWEGKRIQRVILDSRLRCPVDARLLSTLDSGPVLIVTLESSDREKASVLRRKGVEVIELPGERIDIPTVLDRLGEREISSVMAEGGGRLHTALLEAGAADRVLITISPLLIGGGAAPGLLQGEGVKRVEDALHLRETHCFRIEDDMIIEGYL